MYEVGKIYENLISNREAILVSLQDDGLLLKFLWKNPDENIISTMTDEPFFSCILKTKLCFS